MSSTANLLELKGVHTHIGAYHILHGVNLAITKGQLTMLLGRNADEQPGQHRFEQAWLVATVECVPLLVHVFAAASSQSESLLLHMLLLQRLAHLTLCVLLSASNCARGF